MENENIPLESNHSQHIFNPQTDTKSVSSAIPVINMSHFCEVEANDKLDLLMIAINKINASFHYQFEALHKEFSSAVKNVCEEILPKVTSLQTTCEELQAQVYGIKGEIPEFKTINQQLSIVQENVLPNITDLQTRVHQLEEVHSNAVDDITTLKGFAQVHNKQILSTQHKVVKLTARSMVQNIVIHGLTPDGEEEDAKDQALLFFKNKMKMGIEDNNILMAHRIGKKTTAKPCPMVVRCSQYLHDNVFAYTKNLKDLQNELGDYYFVKPQLPEPFATERRTREKKLKVIRKENAELPPEQAKEKVEAEIKDKVLFINKVPQKTYVFPPTVQDIFETDSTVQCKIDQLPYVFSNKEEEKGSLFRVLAFRANNPTEVHLAYRKVKQLFPDSDHIMLAYILKPQQTGWQDDNEFGAGEKIMQILQDQSLKHTAVFVMRKFSRVHLGPRRFMYIQKVAREALEKLKDIK